MPGPILAAYDPFKEDRAPIELALAAAELTGAPVVAVAVAPTALETGWTDPTPIYEEVDEIVTSALARLRDDTGVETTSASGRSVPQVLHELATNRDRPAAGRRLDQPRGHRSRAAGQHGRADAGGSPCPVALAPHGYRRAPVRTSPSVLRTRLRAAPR